MNEDFVKSHPLLLPAGIAAALLLLALTPMPYGYYTLMRLAVCAASVFVAYTAYTWEHVWATCVFGVVAALFNPIAPIHLTREIWRPIDIGTAVLFLVSSLVLEKPAGDGGEDTV